MIRLIQDNQRKISRGDYNRIVDAVNNQRMRFAPGSARTFSGINGTSVIPAFRQSASSTPVTGPWAPTVNGADVTISKGPVLVLGRNYQELDGMVTITGGSASSPHYIVVLIPRAGGSASLSVQASAPNPSNATNIEWPIHEAYMNGTTAVIKRTLETGVIFVGALT